MEELELLLAFTEKQEELLACKELNMEKFDTIVNKKERIINQLKAEDPKGERVFSEDEKAILKKIMELDEKNHEQFIKHYEYTKEQLRKIRAGKKQNNFYVNNYSVYNNEEGMYFDKRGK